MTNEYRRQAGALFGRGPMPVGGTHLIGTCEYKGCQCRECCRVKARSALFSKQTSDLKNNYIYQ